MHVCKLIHATAAVSLLVAPFALSPLPATPGQGFQPNPIGAGNVGELNINTAGEKYGKWGLHLKTLADTDISADRLVIQPMGFSGWHAHPGPVLVVVTQGSIVWTNGSDPLCTPHNYTVGQAFIEEPFVVHNVQHTSGTTAEFLAFTIKPEGVVGPAFRLDRDKPTNCP